MALLSTPLFALLIVAYDYLEIFHLEIVSILGNRVVRFKEEIERKRESNFRRRRGEICEIYSYTENVAGGVREAKIGYLKTVAIFNCSQEEERGGGG